MPLCMGEVATSTYSWDYRNRLTQITNGISTSTYAYDYTDQRVKQTVGSTTTIYPNKYFSVTGATTTAYIYVGDTLIATIEGNGSATSTSYVHPDHLGSTNVLTNASGTPVQVLDFLPYGSQRYASSTYPTNEKHKFIGQYFDDATLLSYLNARYMDPARGQFLSEDPIFLGDFKQQNLTNPQSLNSYSYGDDNPVVKSDPTGNQASYDPLNPNNFRADFYRSAEAKYYKAGLALNAAGMSGAIILGAGLLGGPVPAFGAAGNIALRATSDLKKGEMSTPLQYAGSGVFGAGTAALTAKSGIIATIGFTGLSSAAEGQLADRSLQPNQVVSNSFGAGVGKYTGNAVSTISALKPLAPILRPAVETASAYGATVFLNLMLDRKAPKDK